jgi:peptide deformylase
VAARRILQLGDPLLRAVSTPTSDAAETRRILADLRDTLHEFRCTHGFGRGISAIQIGEAKRIIYIEFEGTAYHLIDPEFERLSAEKFRLWDDCFSFPGLMVYLERSRAARLRYTDLHGGGRTVEAEAALQALLAEESGPELQALYGTHAYLVMVVVSCADIGNSSEIQGMGRNPG